MTENTKGTSFLEAIKEQDPNNLKNQNTQENQTEDENLSRGQIIHQIFKTKKALTEYRTWQIINLIHFGAENKDIRLFASDHHWDATDDQIEGYIAKARNEIKRSAKELIGLSTEWHLAQRLELLQQCKGKNKFSDALKILDSLRDTQGLTPKPSSGIDVTVNAVVEKLIPLFGGMMSENEMLTLLGGGKNQSPIVTLEA